MLSKKENLFVVVVVCVVGARAVQNPCGDDDNVKTCICKNGRTYYQSGPGYFRIRCAENINPVQSCNCYDGTTWEANQATEPPPRPDNTQAPPRPDICFPHQIKPCGNYEDVESCTCEDGKTYDDAQDMRCFCKEESNPIQSCKCTDGFSWDPIPLYDY